MWGDGEQTVDLVYVDDVARMLVDAIDFGDDAIFDAGTGEACTVNFIAGFIASLCGSSAGVEHLPMRRGEVPTKIVARGEGWDRLSWQPRLQMRELAATVRAKSRAAC